MAPVILMFLLLLLWSASRTRTNTVCSISFKFPVFKARLEAALIAAN